jgi:hypothetical protein
MALTRRIATVYNHTQDTPAATWTIIHNLHDYPIVDAYVTVDGELQKVIPQAVTYVSDTTCTVSFGEVLSGYASVV